MSIRFIIPWRNITLPVLMSVILICNTPNMYAEKEPENIGKVLIVPIKDQIDKTLLFFLRRIFQTADRNNTIKAIVIDMDTPGGALRETEEIIAWMRSFNAKGIPIYVYVNPRAQSAGAIISLASDGIFMAPGSRIGSAAPILMNPMGGPEEMSDDIKEKILSDTRALVRGLAQEKGYIPDLAVAMVDNNVEVKIGDRIVCPKGELLNLTAKDAVEVIPPREKPLLATGIVSNIPELIKWVKLGHLEPMEVQPDGAEELARWITMLAPLLMAAAFIGIYIEFKTPGFGIPGIIGIVSLVLFLFGHYIAGLAGKEDVFLVILGITLIAVEVFVLPGFGIAGILGIGALLGGMILAMIPHLPKNPDLPKEVFRPINLKPFLDLALFNFMATIAITGIGVFTLAKLLPKTKLYNSLILQKATTVESGYVGTNVVENSKLLGQTGMTLTPLRPSGIALIEDQRVDVVSSGDYIDRDESVIVIEVNGPRIVVDLAKTAETGPSDKV